MDNTTSQSVRRRKVFYISGFDPKGPAYYHALYCEEAEKQSELNGMAIKVGDARRNGRLSTRWQIKSEVSGLTVETDYEVLRWDDIMRSRMAASGPAFYWNVVRTYWLFLRTGALWRILKTSYPAFLAGLYPAAFLAGFAALAVISALTLFIVFPDRISIAGVSADVPVLLVAILSTIVFVLVFGLSRRLEQRVPFFWPLHVYAFAADHMRGRLPEMNDRIEQFARQILNHLQHSDDDEVLIASHSNGTVIAVSTLARALYQDPELAQKGRTVSLLTLGESIPLCSFLPQAEALRRDLQTVAGDNGIDWIDITAPRDAACFALTDPLAASGLPAAGGHTAKPKLLSVPISDLFSAKTFRSTLLHRWLRIHFQYLMAYERPTPYDYFLISAGTQTLAERFERFPSKNGFAKFRIFG